MDQSVLDAVKRWPDVPAVFGWLSLTPRGEWRLHPLGDAQRGGPGEGISNPQILGFMNRNYAAQPNGAWYFQNGPQRVYVRIDAAPLIIRVDPATHTLTTHNGLLIRTVTQWYYDETGQLYAKTDCGPGRIDDRDLLILSEVLQSDEGRSLFEALEASPPVPGDQIKTLLDPHHRFMSLSTPAALVELASSDLPHTLQFIQNPGPDTVIAAALPVK